MRNVIRLLIVISFILLPILLVKSERKSTIATSRIEILEEQIQSKNIEIDEVKETNQKNITQNKIHINNYLKANEELEDINSKLLDDLLILKIEIEELDDKFKNRISKVEDIRILTYGDGQLRYVYENVNINDFQIPISIIGYDTTDLLLPREGIETLDYTDGSGAKVKLKVLGSLYDFKILELGWDADAQDTYEKSVICELEEVRNQDIFFSSSQSEGMYSEVIKWKDDSGNEHTYYIAYDGFGFAGNIIMVENY